ncbi:carbohydrate binding domain-containing protein [Weeksellaceae bacterium TAE3-ERU29]|nr:carbohydrate binding domain-containing protein [Weeksellaceae bacterium TAE3-ERU29]
MKQFKIGLFTLLVGLFGLLTVNAQNLIPNGNFEEGQGNWNLGRDVLFKQSGGRNDSKCVATKDYLGAYNYPRLSQKFDIALEGGKTYVVSMWVSNKTDLSLLKGSFSIKTNEDESLYGYNTLVFEEVETDGNWKKVKIELAFPESAAKMTQFGLTFSKMEDIWVDDIKMVKKENPAPKNFKVVDDKLSQRGALLSWDAKQGKVYKVMVNNKTYTVNAGNMLAVTDLSPNTEYTASIYADGTPDAKSSVTFKTKNYIKDNEEERVPFLANIVDGKIDGKFLYAIEDLTGNEIEDIKVTFNDSPATVEGGYVTLPNNVNEGKLVVEVTQKGGEKTVLTYNSITKK